MNTEAAQPTQPNEYEQPITARTQAIVTRLDHLQNVEKELREIRRILECADGKRESRWAALKRAVNQFFSQT